MAVGLILAIMSCNWLAPSAAAAAPACLAYEPAVVQLQGLILRETFPGPPNYTDVGRGDKPEVVWLVKLSQPACVDAKEPDELYPGVSNVERLQLVLDAAQYNRFAGLVGRDVVVSGKLFAAHSAHHRTQVLIAVHDMKVANRP